MKQRIRLESWEVCLRFGILYLVVLSAKDTTGLETVFLQDSCRCTAIDEFRCDSYILGPVQHGAGHVALARSRDFQREFYCKFIIEAPRHQKIQIQINTLEIPWTKHCRSGMLRIYDGIQNNGGWQIVELCGVAPAERIFRSASHSVTLYYLQTGPLIDRLKSFNLTFTYFHLTTGEGDSCNSSRHIQCDNGICVSAYLRCDNYNHCGDLPDHEGYTEEEEIKRGFTLDVCNEDVTPKTSPVTGVTLGIVIVAVVFVVLLVITIYTVRKKKGPFFRRNQPLSVIQNASAGTGPQNGGPGRPPSLVCSVTPEPPSDVLYQEGSHRHSPPPSYSELFPDR